MLCIMLFFAGIGVLIAGHPPVVGTVAKAVLVVLVMLLSILSMVLEMRMTPRQGSDLDALVRECGPEV
ncbi:MAG: hypothetical protein GF331_24455 [Chitinivibrionales bacterium]|nr:hypothetical protein [Chitinivibrionales bacterium]